MAARSLDERVTILEQKVGDLQLLPARMDALESQILQLRGEMRVEFSAIRERFEETRQLAQELHRESLVRLQEGDKETRQLALELHQEVLTQLQEGDKENGRLMRVLHEDVVARISLLGENRERKKR